MSSVSSISEQKRLLRQKQRQAGTAFYAKNRSTCSAMLFSQLQKLDEFKTSRSFFCFVGTKAEPDTFFLLQTLLESGCRVSVPLCTGLGQMEARQIFSLEDLHPGQWNIWEPASKCPLMPTDKIDFALVPCLCCDLQGHRLGHGGGYYDRYLKDASFPWAVFCPETLLSETVPVEPFDLCAPILITEKRILRF